MMRQHDTLFNTVNVVVPLFPRLVLRSILSNVPPPPPNELFTNAL